MSHALTDDSPRRPPPEAEAPAATFAALVESVGSVVAAPAATVRLAVACVAAGGHLLVEDHPGLGKTTLATALSRSLGLETRRIQCTADLLPVDVVGALVLGRDGGEPTFRPGPVFTNILVADELNRSSPRSQSALFEAMQEGRVTVDGVTRPLPRPFLVLATQNPFHDTGTTPLPHGQRDRFLLRLTLGYPDRDQMDAMVAGVDPAQRAASLEPACSPADLRALSDAAGSTHLAPALRGYLLDLVDATRNHDLVVVGASPRATLALARVAATLAVAAGRTYVVPEDLQASAVAALAHRLLLRPDVEVDPGVADALVAEIVDTVPVPVAAG